MLSDLVLSRQSCRNFDKTKTVEQDKLNYLLTCGENAPSARNRQPWRYVVVSSPEKVAAVRECCQILGANKFLDNVNTFIVALERPRDATAVASAAVKIQDFRPLDIGISTGYMSLAAEEMGLGMCFIGMYSEKSVQTVLNVTDGVRIVLALGYAANDDEHRLKSRRDKPETTETV